MITFTRTSSHYDETSGETTVTETSISGGAVVTKGDPLRYQALGLVQSVSPNLLFTPAGYPLRAFTDEFVKPGDTCVLNGVTMTVRDVQVTAPDGTVVISNIIVSV